MQMITYYDIVDTTTQETLASHITYPHVAHETLELLRLDHPDCDLEIVERTIHYRFP